MKIDFHYHYADQEGFVEGLLKEMDESAVDITLLMGGPEEAYWEYKNCRFASNEKVLKAVKDHPDRLIGNVYLDPREPNSEDILERYMDEGFKCVKMFPPVGFMPDDERYFPLYEKIEQRGVPLLFHAGLTNIQIISKEPGKRKATNSKCSYPLNFDMISRLFPKMPIVLAHMGYPHYIEARAVAHANQNVFLDISGSGPWTEGIPIMFNALGGHQFIPMDFNRVLWGSDNCLTQAEHIARSDVYLRQMGASSHDRMQIFSVTAMKLLGLKNE
jgi:predicted TIM-barrel fold metal-dependent hydrolase